MLDIKWINQNRELFYSLLLRRGVKVDVDYLLCLDEKRRAFITKLQNLKKQKNIQSRIFSKTKIDSVKQKIDIINSEIDELILQVSKSGSIFKKFMDNIPNLPLNCVPVGDKNVVVRSVGKTNSFNYTKAHHILGQNLGMLDLEDVVRISGSRFVMLKGKLAQLHRALINFMIDTHVSHFGFCEIVPPALVNPIAMYNVGQLPKFSNDSYLVSSGSRNYRLIPTGEVPLVNIVFNKSLSNCDLPKRFVAYTECFRSEAGSFGKDNVGMIRSHQFGKVELVIVSSPYNSTAEHDYMLNAIEYVLKQLCLSYRVVLLSTKNIGFSSCKTYDIEVWLPSNKVYKEISSVSNCGDFQSRRMNARFKNVECKDTSAFVHTLNGSGLAIGRTIVAILEHYQNQDGSITVPEVLKKYMGGTSIISKFV